MEKRNNWNIGDLILELHSNKMYKIYGIKNDTDRFSIVEMRNIKSYWDYNTYPLLYMDKYFKNLGKTGKGLDILWLK